ncbi:MAG: HypC/HybG/HupF family hydrogenase formation chaperone [Bacteroidota bacterium]|nr:HypC/HybG/HupF family hydrogenase formation chaperone [Bacteroidota bacterium]
MCLAVPGIIITIEEVDSLRMAKVSFGGVMKQICLEWVPEAKIGDYVIVHVGFALNIVDEKEAEETLKMISEIEALMIEEEKQNTTSPV